MNIAQSLIAEALRHAKSSYPRESCGLVVERGGQDVYYHCRNVSPNDKEFEIDPRDLVAAEDFGKIKAVVHSHCDWSAAPTMVDRVACEKSKKTWLIVAWPMGTYFVLEPEGYRAPLIGREFKYGILDCYSLVRDYYRERLAIDLPDFDREDFGWWRGATGPNLFLDHYIEAGFVEIPVNQVREHDALLFQWAGRTAHHCGVMTKNNMILHHRVGQLSKAEYYDGALQRSTVKVLRHSSRLQSPA